jgi:hypothetical protein
VVDVRRKVTERMMMMGNSLDYRMLCSVLDQEAAVLMQLTVSLNGCFYPVCLMTGRVMGFEVVDGAHIDVIFKGIPVATPATPVSFDMDMREALPTTRPGPFSSQKFGGRSLGRISKPLSPNVVCKMTKMMDVNPSHGGLKVPPISVPSRRVMGHMPLDSDSEGERTLMRPPVAILGKRPRGESNIISALARYKAECCFGGREAEAGEETDMRKTHLTSSTLSRFLKTPGQRGTLVSVSLLLSPRLMHYASSSSPSSARLILPTHVELGCGITCSWMIGILGDSPLLVTPSYGICSLKIPPPLPRVVTTSSTFST